MAVFFYNTCLKIMVLIERLCVNYPSFGSLYHKLFYASVIEREITLASLKPGERVLHIGGGSYPFTALHLARYGCNVCLIDNNDQAVVNAKQVVIDNALTHRIEAKKADGQEVSGADFDAVWISLLVHPKEEIVRNLLTTLPKQGRIIYRNPRGNFRFFSPVVDPNSIAPQYRRQITRQMNKKESVIIAR